MLMERTQLGKIEALYFEQGTLDSTWRIYPLLPERVDLTSRPGWLRILPGSEDVYVVRDLPAGDFVCECRIDFIPTSDMDRAGLCLFSSEDMVIKLLSYYNAADPAVYDRLRLVKTGDTIEAWTRNSEGIWYFKGSTQHLPGSKVGFFLESSSTRPVEIDQLELVKSTIVQVDNLPTDSRVVLIKDGVVLFDQVEVNNQAHIDLQQYHELIMQAQIIVLNTDGAVIADTGTTEIAGGDIFWHSYVNLDVYYNGEPLNQNMDNMLGNINNGIMELKLTAHNPDKFQSITAMAMIEPEPGYYGYDWVEVAPDMSGVPGAWGKEVSIGTVAAAGTIDFWLRIVKRPVLKLVPELHKFRLKVVGGAGGVS